MTMPHVDGGEKSDADTLSETTDEGEAGGSRARLKPDTCYLIPPIQRTMRLMG
jgi:hypothetical protein